MYATYSYICMMWSDYAIIEYMYVIHTHVCNSCHERARVAVTATDAVLLLVWQSVRWCRNIVCPDKTNCPEFHAKKACRTHYIKIKTCIMQAANAAKHSADTLLARPGRFALFSKDLSVPFICGVDWALSIVRELRECCIGVHDVMGTCLLVCLFVHSST